MFCLPLGPANPCNASRGGSRPADRNPMVPSLRPGSSAPEEIPRSGPQSLQEKGRLGGGGGGGVTPMTRPPASIALPGRSMTQFTVLPVALAAWPTKTEMPDSTEPTGPRSTTGGGAIWAGAAGVLTTTDGSACTGGPLGAGRALGAGEALGAGRALGAEEALGPGRALGTAEALGPGRALGT